MHGRVKKQGVAASDPQELADLKARVHKGRLLIDSLLLAKKKHATHATSPSFPISPTPEHEGAETERDLNSTALLGATLKLLEFHSDFGTIWNFRRTLLSEKLAEVPWETHASRGEDCPMHEACQTPEDCHSHADRHEHAARPMHADGPSDQTVGQPINNPKDASNKEFLRQELAAVGQILMKSQKSYSVWHHRLWVIQQLLDQIVTGSFGTDADRTGSAATASVEIVELFVNEIRLSLELLCLDDRNFHGWAHLQWLLELLRLNEVGDNGYRFLQHPTDQTDRQANFQTNNHSNCAADVRTEITSVPYVSQFSRNSSIPFPFMPLPRGVSPKVVSSVLDFLHSRFFEMDFTPRNAKGTDLFPKCDMLMELITRALIEKNFSNYSAWHMRSKLRFSPGELGPLGRDVPKQAAPDGEPFAIDASEELEWVRQGLYTEPKDESLWQYYRWVLFHQVLTSPVGRIGLRTVRRSRQKYIGTLSKDGTTDQMGDDGQDYIELIFTSPVVIDGEGWLAGLRSEDSSEITPLGSVRKARCLCWQILDSDQQSVRFKIKESRPKQPNSLIDQRMSGVGEEFQLFLDRNPETKEVQSWVVGPAGDPNAIFNQATRDLERDILIMKKEIGDCDELIRLEEGDCPHGLLTQIANIELLDQLVGCHGRQQWISFTNNIELYGHSAAAKIKDLFRQLSVVDPIRRKAYEDRSRRSDVED